mmetsp:Transcript_14700/g.21566  ORF Transcript_14700/g.21566 Transcript_14700/m.21566 type:complete len:241 (+) Transcript_14700:2274-2996(+)
MPHQRKYSIQHFLVWLAIQSSQNEGPSSGNFPPGDGHVRNIEATVAQVYTSLSHLSRLVIVNVQQKVSIKTQIRKELTNSSYRWLLTDDSSLDDRSAFEFNRNGVIVLALKVSYFCNLEALLSGHSVGIHNTNLHVQSWLHDTLDQPSPQKPGIDRLLEIVADDHLPSGCGPSNTHRQSSKAFRKQCKRKEFRQLFLLNRGSIDHRRHQISRQGILHVGGDLDRHILLCFSGGSAEMRGC